MADQKFTEEHGLPQLYKDVNGDGTVFAKQVYTGAAGGGGDASAANQTALNTLTGAVTEAAPASDTASSGLNGRLQRIAQRLTTLIAFFAAGHGTAAAAIRVELPTDGTGQVIAYGDVAHDGVDSGNPQKMGFKAQNAFPTAVANNDRTNGIADLFGRQLNSHIDPAQSISKAFNATTTQTGTDVWSPASGKKIAVTSLIIASYGTTPGRIILWFGDNADTTYTAGTDQVLAAISVAPDATSKPGMAVAFAVPVFCTTADRELHCTTDGNISVDVTVHGYEF